ncbi:SAM-dependent methyltransferase [Romboutsia maritimum]|uniref:SAM-dependent methyltransferase n=1 Tax=Romboutsia maritimum TaxID=2020948 RepID=A0A371IVX8_9FIRM|nr:class I SAM-dependent methyltransferase [Romboutsia maritimum]RDY24629.1 SAM-dependent methyltransferase [Romboutsia maritimum]
MKLTDRLLKIASLVTKDKKIADIGTDHGYIPVYLLNKAHVSYAILADVNKGPLDNAKKEVKYNNLLDNVDLRLGSGIEVLEQGEVDEVIIAGMGGILISQLLEAKLEVAHTVDKLILQPMQAQDELRRYLYKNGFEILDEVLVKEDFRIYEIIIAKYTGNITNIEDEIYLEVGKKLIENKDPLLEEFINKKIHMYKSILNKIEGKSGEVIEQKRQASLSSIKKLENLIK